MVEQRTFNPLIRVRISVGSPFHKYKMSNSFCRNISNSGYFINVGNSLYKKPCCWVKHGSIPITDKDSVDTSLKEIESTIMSDTKKHCRECIDRDNLGYNASHRKQSFDLIPDAAVDGDLYWLQLQVDTTCNAACVMCGPHFSSLWKKQINKNYKLEDYTDLYDKIIATHDFSKLKMISFMGGEPLLSDQNLRIIENVTHPSEVKVIYITNGSVSIDDYLIDIWSKFKRVDIVVSIDGTEDQYDYIRWPLKWSKISDNISKILDDTKDNPNIRINSTFTANPMNIFYFDKLENWANSLNLNLSINVCHHPAWGLDGTPAIGRSYIEKTYGSDHKLTKMVMSLSEVPNKFDSLIKNMELLDSQRNLSYKKTFNDALSILIK